MWQRWLVFIFGLWLIVAPWALSFSASKVATWDSVIFGVLVAGLTLWAQLQPAAGTQKTRG